MVNTRKPAAKSSTRSGSTDAASKAPSRKPAAKKPAAKKAPAPAPEKLGIKDLQEIIYASMPLVAKSTVDQIVSATFDTVAESLQEGKIVAIKDFGKFEVRHREARTARNPRTGESVLVDAKTVPKFSFARSLKTSLV